MSQVLSSIQYIFHWKTSDSNMGAPNVLRTPLQAPSNLVMFLTPAAQTLHKEKDTVGTTRASLSVISKKVVSILLVIFWRQQIGWNYCAGSRRFGLVAWRNTKKKVTLWEKCCSSRDVTVMCYGCYSMPIVFGSTLALLTFVFFLYFFSGSA